MPTRSSPPSKLVELLYVILIATTLVLLPLSRGQALSVVTWDNTAIGTFGDVPASANDFDTGVMTFPGFTANVLTGVTGGGLPHAWGRSNIFGIRQIERRMDFDWSVRSPQWRVQYDGYFKSRIHYRRSHRVDVDRTRRLDMRSTMWLVRSSPLTY